MNSNPNQQISNESRQSRSSVRSVLRTIGSSLATLVMVGIITGCIVASVLTVYILQSIGSEEPVSLDSIDLGYTSIIIAYDKNGEEIELARLYDPENNRIPIDFEDITQYTKDAIVSIEDKRFYDHNGVDWIRTTGAFINMFVPIYPNQAGGSTIHQQLIKNITGDDDIRIDRKVREIFRALNLAQNYSTDQVLEAYLNVVPFGAGTSGIQAAANVYFNKDAKDLTLAESASIVGITQKPTAYNPLLYPEENKKRQKMVLGAMLEQERITQAEYDEAINEPLHFEQNVTVETQLEPNSYFVDHVIESVITDLMKEKNLTRDQAGRELFLGGYRIYTTVDMEIQEHLEEFYSNVENFPPVVVGANDEYPQSNAVVMDHHGKILGLVGGRGTKTESRSFNRATMAKRQPGSTFKPIGPYALALEYNMITPSTIIEDSPVTSEDSPDGVWPRNYYGGYVGPVTVERAITNSINTVAVKVGTQVTPQSLFDFYYYDLEMTNLVDPTDIAIAPMALGAVTDGVTTLELVSAYQILANGGTYTAPYAYTKVEDSNGRVVLKANMTPRRVLSEDTAVLLNKLTQQVVLVGTGSQAQIPNMPTGGKTGTSDDDIDQWFIGFTPYYVGGVWLGYDKPNTFDKYGNWVKNSVHYLPFYQYPPPILFRDVMAPIHENLPAAQFVDSPDVITQTYCVITGDLVGPNCEQTATTWYKASYLPSVCRGDHATKDDDKDKTDDESNDDKTNDSSSATSAPTPREAPITTPGGDAVDGNINLS